MSHLNEGFAHLWSMVEPAAARQPQREVIFHEKKGWLLDFAWIDRLVALEMDGGTYSAGRHSRGAGQRSDAEKGNAALVQGWRVFHVTSDLWRDDPLSIIGQVRTLLNVPVLFPDAERWMWLARVRTLTRDGMSARANGIVVTRKKLRKYSVLTSSGEYALAGEVSTVLDFILGSGGALVPPSIAKSTQFKASKAATPALFDLD